MIAQRLLPSLLSLLIVVVGSIGCHQPVDHGCFASLSTVS